MDIEKAIEWQKSLKDSHIYAPKGREVGTACDMAIEALEKQIPKKYKLIHPCKSVNYYQCPACDGLLHINENYCGNCGQFMDWSDNE